MQIDPTLKEDMTEQVRIQQLEGQIETLYEKIKELVSLSVELSERGESLQEKLFVPLCLNCTNCRYSPQECVCMLRERVKVYINPDDKVCDNFKPKKTL